ncbi:MAG: hypothetical protein K2H96_07955 [Muribaculaceae bacterium]|nr:hypothetical protein [Muribaculaceae bacterium]
MKDRIDNNKIRALVGRWYSGLTTPEEDRMLANMLASSENLPPDLEADRKLFSELSLISEALPEMPEAYSLRINEALEKEMASERGNGLAGVFSRFHKGWIGRIAVGVAVFFACAFFAMKMIDTPQMDVPGNNTALNGINERAGKNMNMSDDSLQNHYLALHGSHLEAAKAASSAESAYKTVTKREIVKGTGKRVSDRNNNVKGIARSGHSEDYDASDDSHYSQSDESGFIRDNYRVVSDQDEADAILNSIFSRLESNVAMERNKLSKIDLEYDSEMSRLSGIENVGLLKEYIYEETPL